MSLDGFLALQMFKSEGEGNIFANWLYSALQFSYMWRKYKSDFLPVFVLCVRREWRATEARWCCRWQHRRGRRSAGYRWEIWREGQSLSLCRIQTQSCRGSGSGPGSPRPAPAQPATSTARPTSAASGAEQRQELRVRQIFASLSLPLLHSPECSKDNK